jgi:Domain of unknown function (DUF4406)
MKSVYLSGGMRGFPDSNKATFLPAAVKLRMQGYRVFNPAEKVCENDSNFDIREAFREDTDWICREADAIMLLPGWENSKGAKAEKALAEALGLEVMYYG